MTEDWNSGRSDHLQLQQSILDVIRPGGRSPNILSIGQLRDALEDSGFDLIFLEDVAARSSTAAWYHMLPRNIEIGAMTVLHWAWWMRGMSNHRALSAIAVLADAGRAGVRYTPMN